MHIESCVWSTSTPPPHRFCRGIVQHLGIGTPRWRNCHWIDICLEHDGVECTSVDKMETRCGAGGFSEVVLWRPGLAIIG
jgi:hypothetical protein